MKIDRILVAFEYQLDENILVTLGDSLHKFQHFFNARFQILNTPQNAPPNAPRMMFQAENFTINISLNRADFYIDIPTQINKNIMKIINYVEENAKKIFKELFDEKIQMLWVGSIAYILIPYKGNPDALKIAEKYFDSLLKIDRNNRQLSTFNIGFGFAEEKYNRNYTISTYQKLNFNLPVNSLNNNDFIQIKLKNSQIQESGLTVRLDINNKPQIDKLIKFSTELKLILGELESSYYNITKELGINLLGDDNDD